MLAKLAILSALLVLSAPAFADTVEVLPPSSATVSREILKKRATELEDRFSAEKDEELKSGMALELGDLYHLLGRIADNRKEWGFAEHYHRKSLTFYKQSKTKFSMRLGRNNTSNMAAIHLKNVLHSAHKIRLPFKSVPKPQEEDLEVCEGMLLVRDPSSIFGRIK